MHSVLMLTCTCRPIPHHAFRAQAAAIRAKAVEALDSLEARLSFTLIDIFQARYTCQKHAHRKRFLRS